MENKNTAGHVLALLTIIIWGTTFISTKILLVDFQPVEILFFRFIMGLLALLLVYPHPLKGTSWRQECTFVASWALWNLPILLVGKHCPYLYDGLQCRCCHFRGPIFYSNPDPLVFKRRRKAASQFLDWICYCNGRHMPDKFSGFNVSAKSHGRFARPAGSFDLGLLLSADKKNQQFWVQHHSHHKTGIFLWHSFHAPYIVSI